MRVVEHGEEAEVTTMSAGAARVVRWTGSCGAVDGSVCAFHGIESEFDMSLPLVLGVTGVTCVTLCRFGE